VSYFVLGEGGQKYGPADLATLNQWIGEGRLLPNTMLEDASSGVRSTAGAISGLNFAATAPATGYAPPSQVRPVAPTYSAPTASGDWIKPFALSLGMLILSLVLTFTIGSFGIYTALVGMGAGWQLKEEKPALGWTFTVLNVLAAVFSLYVRAILPATS
jgi:hypothetical protein